MKRELHILALGNRNQAAGLALILSFPTTFRLEVLEAPPETPLVYERSSTQKDLYLDHAQQEIEVKSEKDVHSQHKPMPLQPIATVLLRLSSTPQEFSSSPLLRFPRYFNLHLNTLERPPFSGSSRTDFLGPGSASEWVFPLTYAIINCEKCSCWQRVSIIKVASMPHIRTAYGLAHFSSSFPYGSLAKEKERPYQGI